MPQSRGPSWTGGVSADQCGDDAKWAATSRGLSNVPARYDPSVDSMRTIR